MKCRNYPRRSTIIAASLVAAMTLTQCSTFTNVPTPGDSTSVRSVVDTKVGQSGFNATVDQVTVDAPADVATVGTPVRVEKNDKPLPGLWGQFADRVGHGVEITLGDNEQPSSPITLHFDQVDTDSNIFVLSESNGVISLLSPEKSATLVVQSNHLSSFWPVLIKISDLADTVFTAASDALQMTTPRPGCFRADGNYSDLGVTITRVPSDVAWPCLGNAGGKIRLSVQSNSSVAWRLSTTPEWELRTPTAYTAANLLALSTWRVTSPDVLDEQMMLPGETSEFETSPLSDTKVEMMVDPVLSQVRTLALGIGFLLPDEAVDSISRAECLPDLINSGAVENNPSATGFASVLRCFGAAVGGAAGAVVGLLAAAPAALWSQLEGLLRTATGLDRQSFAVSAREITPLPVGTGAPVALADVEPWLGDWTGPVNQSGSRPYSVRMTLAHDGRTVVGLVEYPELSCSGVLNNAQLVGDALTIQEEITKNGGCLKFVDLTLALAPGRIDYSFNQMYTGSGRLTRPGT